MEDCLLFLKLNIHKSTRVGLKTEESRCNAYTIDLESKGIALKNNIIFRTPIYTRQTKRFNFSTQANTNNKVRALPHVVGGVCAYVSVKTE